MSEEKLSSCAPSLPMPSTIQPEPSRGHVGIGQRELALRMRVAQQEIDCRADAGIGEVAQPAHRRLGSALAAEIGQRDQEMRLPLQACAAPPSASFRRRRRQSAAAAISASIAASRSAIVVSNSRSSTSGRRRAQSRRKSERSKTAARKSRTGPACASNAASRGRPRPAAAAAKSGKVALGLAAVERHERLRRPRPGRRLLPFRCRGSCRHGSPFSGNTIDDNKSGIAGGKIEAAAVELHDRLGEAQAEARARLRAALLQPHETLGGALAVGFVGNARTIVG